MCFFLALNNTDTDYILAQCQHNSVQALGYSTSKQRGSVMNGTNIVCLFAPCFFFFKHDRFICHLCVVFVCLLFLFLFFDSTMQLVGSQFPNQGSNPCPVQWKCGVLTTEPPANSLFLASLFLINNWVSKCRVPHYCCVSSMF